MLDIKVFRSEPFETNCYVVSSGSSALIVDPGGSGPEVMDYIRGQELVVKAIINTHGHGDHVFNNQYFCEESGAPLWIHRDDAAFLTDPEKNLSPLMGAEIAGPPATKLLVDGDRLQVGGAVLEVLHTPGHTPGSICLYGGGLLLSGDTLFSGSQGRTDLPGGSEQKMRSSLARLAKLPDETRVFPGHGEPSTIGREKRSNPFLAQVMA